MNKNSIKNNFQEKINELLRNRKLDSEFLDSKTMNEVIEEISIYHQELEYQNYELMRIQEKLEASKKHYYNLFNEAPLGYVIFDDNYNIEATNHTFNLMLDLNDRNLKNSSIRAFVHPDYQDEFYLHIRKLLKSGAPQSLQLILRTEEKEIPVKIESNIHQEENRVLIRTAIIDMTKERAVGNELQESNQMLSEAIVKANEASATKSQFLANMSHEIRTPLNGILGFLYLLENTKLDSEQLEYIEKIKISSETLSTVINDILDISKIESGRLELEENSFDLISTIEAGVMPYYSQAMDKGLSFKQIISPDLPKKVIGDPIRLRQIITNILGNAVKFTHKGAIILEVDLERACEEEIKLLFSIEDTGIGMSKKHIDNLFTPFTQGDNSVTKKYEGTGLGLVICKNIVNMMGGDMNIESKLGEGTRVEFTVKFRVHNEINEDSEEKSLEPEKEDVIYSKIVDGKENNEAPKILLVEDNEVGRKFFTSLLSMKGLSCDIAVNGKEAFEMIKEKDYDIVFMDCQMPIMSGYKATDKIRKHEGKDKHTIIIAMTAYAMKGDAEKCIESGMDDYISKPINIELVMNMIDKYIDTVPKIANDEYDRNMFKDTVNALMKDSGLDKESSEEILREFCILGPELVEQIKKSYSLGDEHEIKLLLHQLKGSSGNIRALEISKAALIGEEAIRNNDEEALHKAIKEIEKLMNELTRTCNQI